MTTKTKPKPTFPIVIGEHTMPFSIEQDDRLPVLWVNDFDEESAREFFDMFSSFMSDDIVSSILIYIDSFGGHVDSLAAIAEIVNSSSKPVITVAVGKAFSAGALLLSLGDPGNRWVAPNSRLMLHRLQVGGVADASADDVAQIAEEVLRMNDVWMRKLVNQSKMKWNEFNRKLNDQGGQWYMDAKTAIQYGFADYIGLPMIKETRQWVIDIK